MNAESHWASQKKQVTSTEANWKDIETQASSVVEQSRDSNEYMKRRNIEKIPSIWSIDSPRITVRHRMSD